MGKYDMTGVTVDGNNYFSDGGYRLTSAQNFFPTELLDVLQTKTPDATHTDGTVHKSFTVELFVEDFAVPEGIAESGTYQRIIASTNDRFCITRHSADNDLHALRVGRAPDPNVEHPRPIKNTDQSGRLYGRGMLCLLKMMHEAGYSLCEDMLALRLRASSTRCRGICGPAALSSFAPDPNVEHPRPIKNTDLNWSVIW